MRTTIKVFVFVMLAAVTFGQHTTVSGEEPETFKISSAQAFFRSFDPSGCIETLVWVDASEGGPLASAGLTIRQYDNCTGEFLRDAYGSAELAAPDFQLAVANLASATLEVTIPVYDYISNSSFDVYVDLTWTGTGALRRFIDNSQGHDKYCHEISHHNGVTRSAEASGTISDGQTNLTPESSLEARLFLDKYVDITGCKAVS